MKHSWNIKNFPKVTTFKCCFYTRTPSQSCHRGFVELPDPSLQKQMHLQWPDDFSTNKHTDSFRCSPLVFNPLFLALKTKCPLPPGCAKGMPEHSEIRGPPNQTSNVQEEFGILWYLIHVRPFNLNLLVISEIIYLKKHKNADSFEVSGTKWQFFQIFWMVWWDRLTPRSL